MCQVKQNTVKNLLFGSSDLNDSLQLNNRGLDTTNKTVRYIRSSWWYLFLKGVLYGRKKNV